MRKLLIYIPLIVCSFACQKEVIQYNVTTSANPVNSGTITPMGGPFELGQTVVFSANPNQGFTFKNWDGSFGQTNPLSIKIDQNINLSANFESKYKRNINVIGEGAYKETLLATGIQIEAIPTSTTAFNSWEGDFSSNDKKIIIPNDKDYNLVLRFKRKITSKIDTSRTLDFVQRNNDGIGIVPLYVKTSAGFEGAKIKFIPTFGGKETQWISLSKEDSVRIGGKFELTGGTYNANLVINNGNAIVLDTTFNLIRVGEIFGVIGHSLAEGQDPYELKDFNKTKAKVVPYPWNTNVSFWGRLADLVATKINVPVLIYNTGIGGTSSVQWGLSSEGLYFEHPFFDWTKRYPYSIFENWIFRILSKTGVRAILVVHGENDRNDSENEIVLNTKRYINYTKNKLNYQNLTFSICRCGNENTTSWYQKVLNSQTKIVNEVPNAVWGGFLNDIQGKTFRWDEIHFNYAGLEEAAKKWNTALPEAFFRETAPYIPK